MIPNAGAVAVGDVGPMEPRLVPLESCLMLASLAPISLGHIYDLALCRVIEQWTSAPT